MPLLDVQKERIHYVSRRRGEEHLPPVLFIHGAGGSHQHWLYQVRDLPTTVYAVDLPGHGRSDGSGRDTVGGYADWIVHFLDAAQIERAVLAGHSMGGAIVLDMALRYPERVTGLGLVSTGARLRVAPVILDGMRAGPEQTVHLIGDWLFGSQAPQEMVEMARRQMAEVPATVLHGDFLACDAFDVRDRLDGITAPAIVVSGTEDRMTPVYLAAALRDRLPAARLHVVHGAGHMVMIERPESVTRALGRFLASLPAAQPPAH
ncbi:MAG TPA: alpha/beta fold hydrolase [Anaerolineae bacterium]|nr:alpha/beta fold hydrolase [Anaerolineae bacterium]